MADPPPEPDRRLAPAARAAWMLTGAGATFFAGAVITAVLGRIDDAPGWIAPVAITAIGLMAIVVLPVLRYRTFRYAVRDEEIDYLHGAFVRTRTVVPMARVQHVETQRGMIDQALEITTLRIHTAAGVHKIPGLQEGAAVALRTEIAQRARVPDEV